ncbi:MAG: molybdopterin-guanine dinucleotide biosynthesis protein MobB [Kiloniellaceae bacterium]
MTSMQSLSALDRERVRNVKKAYTTHRVPRDTMAILIDGDIKPNAGDLVLARVDRLGHHTKLELPDGRRAQMFAGDEIVVCYGNRYATDQFEVLVGDDLSPCHLAAAGGVAGTVRASHDRARRATRITPLGLIGDRRGQRLNLRDFALPRRATPHRVPTLAVVGTSMNAGKTTAAAHLIKGLERAGYRVGAAKITGTGAGGDRWQMADAGARDVLDFTDAGYASTYMISPREVEEIYATLLGHLSAGGADIAVVELADGLFQKETAALLGSTRFQRSIDAIVFVAADSVGAVAGAQWLTGQSLPLAALTGLVTRSPLAMREVESWADIPVLETTELGEPSVGRLVWEPVFARRRERARRAAPDGEGLVAGLVARPALVAV